MDERLGSTWIGAHPAVPWTLIRGMRNRIAHDYRALDDDVVWEALTVHAPALHEQLRGEVEEARRRLGPLAEP